MADRPTTVDGYLTTAAGLIERRGLSKHTFADEAGAVCMLGAIGEAACGDPWGLHPTVEQQLLMQACAERVANVIEPGRDPQELAAEYVVSEYSDRPDTTAADAVRVMRAAAEGARS